MTANEWDDVAADWDTNPFVRDYADKAYSSWAGAVAPAMPELAQSKVLDFGCGTGLLTMKLAEQCGQVIAIDPSPKMIEILDNKIEASGPGCNVLTSAVMLDSQAASEHPLLAAKFDMVVASSVCSFLPDYEATLRVLASLLMPGGYFAQWDWESEMPIARVVKAFTAAGLAGQSVDVAFSMQSEEGSADVVMGVGRKAL